MSEDRDAAEVVRLFDRLDHEGRVYVRLLINAFERDDRKDAEAIYRHLCGARKLPVDEELASNIRRAA